MKGEGTGRKICELYLVICLVQDKLEAVVEAIRAVVKAGAVLEGARPGGVALSSIEGRGLSGLLCFLWLPDAGAG